VLAWDGTDWPVACVVLENGLRCTVGSSVLAMGSVELAHGLGYSDHGLVWACLSMGWDGPGIDM
jgi:hypothetical protein